MGRAPEPIANDKRDAGGVIALPKLLRPLITAGAVASVVVLLAACSGNPQTVNVGFYAYFAPVSYSTDESPDSTGFNTHSGYEADLLTALEAMDDGLTLNRRAIAEWPGIWLLSAGDEFDIVGGGITILDARTRNDAGETVVAFTNGHITFRQSLLVRTEDAARLATHDALTSDVLVGALTGTTGEARLLQLTGLADANGVLAAGTRIATDAGEVLADGSDGYVITAANASPILQDRRHIYPPDETMPQVVYLGEESGDVELLDALRHDDIDAITRGAIGNTDAAQESHGAFAVTALDNAVEYGGFTVAAGDAELLALLNERIDFLTDHRRIGYAEWRADPTVFLQRAARWEQ